MTTDRRAANTQHDAIGGIDRRRTPADSAELEGIATRFGSALERYFRKRVFDEGEAEDLVQEVFCRLAARTGAHRIDNPEAYVFQVAANLLRDRARSDLTQRDAKQQFVLRRRNDCDEISPERVVLGRERIVQLRNALNELPERTRTIFVLHRFEDLKYREIARRLGVSASLVEKHIMDAIGHLRVRMGLE